MAGRLFVVATPIGNLEDITLRALRILKEVDLIAAEDTRRTRKLLNHYAIKTPMISYHEFNEKSRAEKIVERLFAGEDVALVSDAGTPAISDPGFNLVGAAVRAGINTQAVPGASALVSALSISAFDLSSFTYLGFLPKKGALRLRRLSELKGSQETFVLFESPVRLVRTLREILDNIGDVDMVVIREMTKVHEEVRRGCASALLERFAQERVRGEVVMIFRTKPEEISQESAFKSLALLLTKGLSVSESARLVSEETGIQKTKIYKEALRLSKK